MEIVYSPSGAKLALMNGSSLGKAFVPLPGGAEAVYSSSGLQYYRHADWLGTSRLATTSSRTLYYSGAYAPFGENYAGLGTQDLSFTGQNQDTEPSGAGGAGGLYDFLYREHSPVQGRWLSPDPAGLAAVNPADPQSWNRYAYVGNRPLNSVDPLGLILMGCDPDDPFCGGCDPDDPFCGPPFCDPDDPLCWGPPIPPRPPGGAPPDYPSIGPGLTELPPGLNSPPLGSGDLLNFLPGLNCGGIGASIMATQTATVPCLPMPVPTIAIVIAAAVGGGNDSSPKNPSIFDSFPVVCDCTGVSGLIFRTGCTYATCSCTGTLPGVSHPAPIHNFRIFCPGGSRGSGKVCRAVPSVIIWMTEGEYEDAEMGLPFSGQNRSLFPPNLCGD